MSRGSALAHAPWRRCGLGGARAVPLRVDLAKVGDEELARTVDVIGKYRLSGVEILRLGRAQELAVLPARRSAFVKRRARLGLLRMKSTQSRGQVGCRCSGSMSLPSLRSGLT